MEKLNLGPGVCHLTFSHSEYRDVWPAYFGEMKRHLPSSLPHYLCVDQIVSEIPLHIEPLVYDEKLSYPRRLMACLESLTQFEYILFDHEDMFLHSPADLTELKSYFEIMKSEHLDHIRFIKGGEHKASPIAACPSLHLIELRSKWIFSIQPGFWRKEVLIKILEANLDSNIWELEVKSQKVVKKMKIRAAYSHLDGAKRGLHHYDNKFYPYVATAIGKGKWNYKEYEEELNPILKSYNIDPTDRGFM